MSIPQKFFTDSTEIDGSDKEVGGNFPHCDYIEYIGMTVDKLDVSFGRRLTVKIKMPVIDFPEQFSSNAYL